MFKHVQRPKHMFWVNHGDFYELNDTAIFSIMWCLNLLERTVLNSFNQKFDPFPAGAFPQCWHSAFGRRHPSEIPQGSSCWIFQDISRGYIDGIWMTRNGCHGVLKHGWLGNPTWEMKVQSWKAIAIAHGFFVQLVHDKIVICLKEIH